MIKSIRHIGIKVKDMEESVAFWEGMGLEKVYDQYEVWKDQKLHVVKLAVPMAEDEHRGPGTCIELVDGNWPDHIAVTVDKLPFSGYHTKRPTGHRILFVVSPDGTRVEMVEEPK